MSRLISKMLDEPERRVTKKIAKLEAKTGYPSHDVRLLAENIQTIRAKISSLGLDPDDTTAPELYHALLVKFEADSQDFDAANNVLGADFDHKSQAAAKILNGHKSLPGQWAVKTSAAKDILRQHPPKRVMKQLHYRSVDSLLKHEDIAEIYLALPFVESPTWQKLHTRAVNRLGLTGFETRPVKVVSLSRRKWGNITGPSEYVALDNTMAAAGAWPDNDLKDSPLITMILLIAESLPGVNLSELKLGESIAWWGGMDHVIADLDSGHVSLNLKDAAVNNLQANDYPARELSSVRKSFWRELVSRYDNAQKDQPPEYSFEDILSAIKAPLNQPAYEFAEDSQE